MKLLRRAGCSIRNPQFAIRNCASLLGMLCAMALTGCMAEKNIPRTDYFPLRDGNRWEYRLLDRPLLKRLADGQAIVTAPLNADVTRNQPGDDAELVPKAEVVGGSTEEPGEATSSTQARRVALELRAAVDDLTYKAIYDTAEQVWSKKSAYVGFQNQRGRNYLLILPPHSHYKWVVTGPAGQDLFYEVESAAASVSTPAGRFDNCAVARQESRDRREIFRFWFAPNVGLVRRSKYFLEEEVFRQELVEFTVKPATPATRMAEDREVRTAVEGKNRGSEFRDRREDRARRPFDPVDAPLPGSPEDRVERFSAPR